MQDKALGRNRVTCHFERKEKAIGRNRVTGYFDRKKKIKDTNEDISEFSFFD